MKDLKELLTDGYLSEGMYIDLITKCLTIVDYKEQNEDITGAE